MDALGCVEHVFLAAGLFSCISMHCKSMRVSIVNRCYLSCYSSHVLQPKIFMITVRRTVLRGGPCAMQLISELVITWWVRKQKFVLRLLLLLMHVAT